MSNDDYPPDDEYRSSPDFPPATALPCRRIEGDIVHFRDLNDSSSSSSSSSSSTAAAAAVSRKTVVVVRSNASPLIVPEPVSSVSEAGGGFAESAAAVIDHSEGVGGVGGVGGEDERAYALLRVIRDAIYGKIWLAEGVRRVKRSRRGDDDNTTIEFWETTGERFAMKVMPWDTIRYLQGRITEDPINEVRAMQFFRRWYEDEEGEAARWTGTGTETVHDAAVRVMAATNVLVFMIYPLYGRHTPELSRKTFV